MAGENNFMFKLFFTTVIRMRLHFVNKIPDGHPGPRSAPPLCLWLRAPRDAPHGHQGAAPGSWWSPALTSGEIVL